MNKIEKFNLEPKPLQLKSNFQVFVDLVLGLFIALGLFFHGEDLIVGFVRFTEYLKSIK